LTRGEGRTLADAIAIVRGLGYRIALVCDPSPLERFRPRRGALDISRARRLLDYEPRHSLEAGLARLLEQPGPARSLEGVRHAVVSA
jgi:nucleoside-diphosphate-sugar epimerase